MNPYGRIRASRLFEINPNWSFEPAQFLIWELEDGFGEKTRIDFNFVTDEFSLTRSRTEALWAEETRGVDLYHEISHFHQLDAKSFYGIIGSLTAFTRPGFTPEEYRIALRYRSELNHPWLVGEIEPALAFPDNRDHEITAEIIFRIDFYFDRLAQVPFVDQIKGTKDARSRSEKSLQIDRPN